MAHGAHTTAGPQTTRSFWRSPFGITATMLAVIASIYVYVAHQAHLYALLPYLFLAACPLMHLFMHGGHGHGRGRGTSAREQDAVQRDREPRKG